MWRKTAAISTGLLVGTITAWLLWGLTDWDILKIYIVSVFLAPSVTLIMLMLGDMAEKRKRVIRRSRQMRRRIHLIDIRNGSNCAEDYYLVTK